MSPQLLQDAKFPNSGLPHPRGPWRPSLQPLAARQPRPSHPLRIRRARPALWALSFQPLKQVAGKEGGERLLCPPPQQPGSGGGGTTGPTAPEGGGSDLLAPPATVASGHPGPTGPTLGKPSIATPHSASSTPITVPWRARCLGLICANACLMPDLGNAERKKGMRIGASPL